MKNNSGWKGNKQKLPQKYCLRCKKLFSRRKKRQRDRSEVKYCSKKCKHET